MSDMQSNPQQSPQFLTYEEAEAVNAALLSSHEKFLARLTISSKRLLDIIAKDTGVSVEELTSDRIIAWFEKDGKTRREQGEDAAVLRW